MDFFIPLRSFFPPKTPYLAISKNFCALIGLSIWIEVNGGDTIVHHEIATCFPSAVVSHSALFKHAIFVRLSKRKKLGRNAKGF